MSEKSTALSTQLLDHVLRVGTSYTPPTTVNLVLSTTNISPDGTGINKPTWGGYADQAVTFGAAAAGSISNTNQIDFLHGGTGGTQTVVSVALEDQAGNLLYFDNDFIDTAVSDGETLRFTAGNVTATEA